MTDVSNDTQQHSAAFPSEFDRLLGLLDGLTGVSHTKGSTITVVPPMGVGGSRTFIVQTYRQRDEHAENGRSRDTIFLQMGSGSQFIRLALPAEVADVIARQREALTTVAKKRVGRALAAVRKASGITPSAATIAAMRKGLDSYRKKRKAAKKAKG